MADKKVLTNQEGAAWLIGIITLLLIFYVVFLPPQEREKLLEEKITEKEKPLELFLEENLLLKEELGYLATVPTEEKEILIPNFLLQETKPDVVLRVFNPFTVKKALFTRKTKTVTFNLPKLEDISNLRASFQTLFRNGILNVELNDHEVFDARVKQHAVVINLPKELLKEENELVFSTNGGFFEKKEYQIEDLKVIGTVSEIEKLTSLNPFTLTESEYKSIESGKLRLYISCDQSRIGYIKMRLNSENVYSGIPVCGDFVQLQFEQKDFREGRNTLVFEGEKGTYDVSELKLKLDLKKTKSYIQYFEVTDALYSDLVFDRFKKLVVEIDFFDDGEQKLARINVNGRYKTIDQKTAKFKWVLTAEPEVQDVVLPGRNYLELTPLEPVTVRELRVRVE
ncbi:hypothetical protein HYV79_02610 [Candidatus Woesearchaeota archaeon]|nr:hypothetical protein [Candidatus Woesearchaeota archaeon]